MADQLIEPFLLILGKKGYSPPEVEMQCIVHQQCSVCKVKSKSEKMDSGKEQKVGKDSGKDGKAGKARERDGRGKS